MKDQMVKVTRGGQITIPKEIRDYLGIKVGSEMVIGIDEKYGQTILMEKMPDLPSWEELLKDMPVLFDDKENGDDKDGE